MESMEGFNFQYFKLCTIEEVALNDPKFPSKLFESRTKYVRQSPYHARRIFNIFNQMHFPDLIIYFTESVISPCSLSRQWKT